MYYYLPKAACPAGCSPGDSTSSPQIIFHKRVYPEIITTPVSLASKTSINLLWTIWEEWKPGQKDHLAWTNNKTSATKQNYYHFFSSHAMWFTQHRFHFQGHSLHSFSPLGPNLHHSCKADHCCHLPSLSKEWAYSCWWGWQNRTALEKCTHLYDCF